MLRILSHVGRLEAITLPPEIAARVEIIPIPMDGDLDEGVEGEVLLSTPTAVPNLADALSRGVRWVHLIGTGIDQFPVELIGPDRVLTNSRGLSAVPISEWVMACMLAFEKRLPDAWIHEAPGPVEHPRPARSAPSTARPSPCSGWAASARPSRCGRCPSA